MQHAGNNHLGGEGRGGAGLMLEEKEKEDAGTATHSRTVEILLIL